MTAARMSLNCSSKSSACSIGPDSSKSERHACSKAAFFSRRWWEQRLPFLFIASATFSSPFQRRYLGRIESVHNGIVTLSDSGVDEFPADSRYLEGTRSNVEAIGKLLLGSGYDAFSNSLFDGQGSLFSNLGSSFHVCHTAKCPGGVADDGAIAPFVHSSRTVGGKKHGTD